MIPCPPPNVREEPSNKIKTNFKQSLRTYGISNPVFLIKHGEEAWGTSHISREREPYQRRPYRFMKDEARTGASKIFNLFQFVCEKDLGRQFDRIPLGVTRLASFPTPAYWY